ncbi:STAS domain-containing protein [Actinomadura gamaensis]|uniref:Anti-sigma factor antagonist n=1 Tax=Actinomadura gamaensis TaxID=1763541 RepID=A0ABV9TT80_9ACTN
MSYVRGAGAPLDWQVSRRGRHLLVALAGEVDASNSRRLTRRLILLVDQAARESAARGSQGRGIGPVALVVDLAGLRFLDAAGISSLVTAANAAQELGVAYAVAGARGRVARVLEAGGLTGVASWLHPELIDAMTAVMDATTPLPTADQTPADPGDAAPLPARGDADGAHPDRTDTTAAGASPPQQPTASPAEHRTAGPPALPAGRKPVGELLSARTSTLGAFTVIALHGELDRLTHPIADHACRHAQTNTVGAHLILDLSGLHFADANGLAVFVQAMRRADTHGGTLALAAANTRLQRKLSITGLTRRIPVFPTVLAATRLTPLTTPGTTEKPPPAPN